jgi:hypothetical protein
MRIHPKRKHLRHAVNTVANGIHASRDTSTSVCVVHVRSRVASLPLTVSDAYPWGASLTEQGLIDG